MLPLETRPSINRPVDGLCEGCLLKLGMLAVPLYDYEDEIDKRSRPRSGWFRRWVRKMFKMIFWGTLIIIALVVIVALTGNEP